MSKLWVVEWRSREVPEPQLCPDFSDLDVILGDTHFAIIDGTHAEIEDAIRDYPYWKNSGHPADGRHVDGGGAELYIYNGATLDSERALWEAMGHKPADFDGETWDDVDDNVVRDIIPTF